MVRLNSGESSYGTSLKTGLRYRLGFVTIRMRARLARDVGSFENEKSRSDQIRTASLLGDIQSPAFEIAGLVNHWST